MKKTILVLLSVISSIFYSHTVLSQAVDCTSSNEGQREGPYVCRGGRWVYDP